MKKKLYRSTDQKWIAGVCGGIAEYLDWDVTLVRVLYIALSLAAGSGILIYIIAAFIMKPRPAGMKPEYRYVDAEYEIREEDDV